MGCSKDEPLVSLSVEKPVELRFTASIDGDICTKTSFDSENHIAVWKREDMAGLIAAYGDGLFTDTGMKPFLIDGRNQPGDEFLSTASFSGKLTDKGNRTYTYFAAYPYRAFQTMNNAASVTSWLFERQYPDTDSWDGSCDMLASKPITVSSPSVSASNLEIQFSRLFGILRLNFDSSITGPYGAETVESVSIESAIPDDILAGKFTVDMSSEESVRPVMSVNEGEHFNRVTLDYRCKDARLADVEPYFILNPGDYPDVKVTIRTDAHEISFSRHDLEVVRGNLSSAVLRLKAGDTVTGSTSILPRNPESLKILTFGHSFVVDSMEYMDELLNRAGIKNVTFANLKIGNCSLQTYLEHVENAGNTKGGSDKILYYKRYYNGSKVTTLETNKTVIDALCDEDWDIVVMQTSLQYEGFYSMICQPLNDMMDYVRTTCMGENGKAPVFAWHMFWAMSPKYENANLFDPYERDSEQNYAANVQAAREVMRNHGIELVIPTGTMVQTIRHSSMNNSYYMTRDWYHMDIGAGRYAAACTWFEFFIKPCFGVSVLGNTFMPTAYTHMQVTEDNRESLQKAAVLACKYPFEISHLDEILPEDTPHEGDETDFNVVGSIENLSEGSTSDQPESFTLIDNLTW